MTGKMFLDRKTAGAPGSGGIRYDRSAHYLHGLAAAPGDDLPGLDMEDLVADGAVDVAFLLCLYDKATAAFELIFHSVSFPTGMSI